MARDTKLTYFTERDEEYLFWKIEAIATKIEMALNSQTPPPERFARVEDYIKVVEARRLLEYVELLPTSGEIMLAAVLVCINGYYEWYI